MREIVKTKQAQNKTEEKRDRGIEMARTLRHVNDPSNHAETKAEGTYPWSEHKAHHE
jgi:hypothetical protein